MFWVIWTPFQQFMPSVTYDTLDTAIVDAKEKAKATPGLEFYVLAAISKYKMVDDRITEAAIMDESNLPHRYIQKTDFKMRIPIEKWAALLDVIATDNIVRALFSILDDPTLIAVDLDSPYLSNGLDYLISAYPDLVTPADKVEWLR